jgi:hypothetical protein
VRPILIALLVLGAGACDVGEVPPVGGGGGGGTTTTTGGGGTGGGGGGGGGGVAEGPDAAIGGGTVTPAESFQTMIAPLVTRCIGCHSGGQAPNLTSYDLLDPSFITKPGAQSILCTEAADGAQHNGVAYLSTSDKATVAGWIDSLP